MRKFFQEQLEIDYYVPENPLVLAVRAGGDA